MSALEEYKAFCRLNAAHPDVLVSKSAHLELAALEEIEQRLEKIEGKQQEPAQR